jgi:hypothetical protein
MLSTGGGRQFPWRLYAGDVQDPKETSILRTRGWTLQEELLAHREVLCMEPEIRWKCQRVHRTEVGHEFPHSGPWTQDTPLTKLRQLWRDWMSDYSFRAFTFESDRFSALVGLVQLYGERTGYTHVLACWRETMIADLLWLRDRVLVEPYTATGGIPSWSWLTRAKNIVFDFWTTSETNEDNRHTIRDDAQVVEARVEWSGQPLLSDISTTRLVLEGPVQQLRLRIDPRATDYNPPYMKIGDEEPELGGDRLPWQCAGIFDQEDVSEDEHFTCLLMRSMSTHGDDQARLGTMLILVPEQDGRVFRRVGIAMLTSSEVWFDNARRRRLELI